MPLSMEEYLAKARQMYDPGYAEKVAATNNAANTELTNQDNQIGTINKNYDLSVSDNKQTTALNQNSFAGNTLNRGMGRSSIAATGLADLANQGQEKEVRINNERTGKINEVEALKNTIRANLQSTLTGMKSSYESGVSSTAQDMFNRDQDYERQVAETEKQRAWQTEQDRIAYERSLAVARAKSSGSGSSKSKNNNSISDKDKGNNATKAGWEEFLNQLNNGTGGSWLQLNEKELKDVLGTEEYKKMRTAYDNVAAKKSREEATDRGNMKQKYLEESQGYSLYNQ